MEVMHLEEGPRGVFFVEEKRKRLAEMHYIWSGTDHIIVDHTVIFDRRQPNRGYEKHLAHALAAFAKENQLHIIPVCPMASTYLRGTPAYSSVLH